MVRIIVSLLVLLALPSGVLGQINGELLLDRNEIFSCMPVSGVLELRPTQDTKLDGRLMQALSIRHSGYHVIIDEPGGGQTIIDKNLLYSDSSLTYGSPIGPDGVLEGGVVYAIPVFVLKLRDRFLFDSAGDYRITFVYTCLPGEPEFTAKVSVEDCDPCGRDGFTKLFDHQVLVRPFAGGLFIEENGLGLSDTYLDAFAVTMANLSALVGRTFFNSNPGSLTHSFYESDRFRKRIEKGLFWDSTLDNTRGIWGIINDRYTTREEKGIDPHVEKIDKKGRVIILPN